MQKLLAVDDDEQILKQIEWAFSSEYQVYSASDRPAALHILRQEQVPVVLLDLGLPPQPRDATEGLLALEQILTENPLAKVIIVSGNSDRHNALLAVEKGAHDIFPKPVDLDELGVVLKRVYKRIQLEQESLEERNLAARISFGDIIGSSPPMKAVFSTITKVAASDVPVLICGESGTGKELVAMAIHNLGNRKEGPFVAINCSAIPESLLESELFGHEKGAFTGATSQRRGRLEYARSGTLFLDEIGDLTTPLQVKLLRFLQQKVIERVGGRESIQVDCRVIAATHQNLDVAVQEGRFREDLFFRLAVVTVSLPPLRERGNDVIEIAEHLVQAFTREMRLPPRRLTPQAEDAMRAFAWPGNVRELQNRVKRALVLADGPTIGATELELDLPASQKPLAQLTLREAKQEVEREAIIRALQQCGGNISKAAKSLGVSRPTLYDLMGRYGL